MGDGDDKVGTSSIGGEDSTDVDVEGEAAATGVAVPDTRALVLPDVPCGVFGAWDCAFDGRPVPVLVPGPELG